MIINSEHDYTDIEHCKKCVVCSAIALQEINNVDIEKHIADKTKEIFSDDFIHEIQNNLRDSIFSIIDNL